MWCGNPKLRARSVSVSLLAAKSKTLSRTGFNKALVKQLQATKAPVSTLVHHFPNDTVVDVVLWTGTNASVQSRFQVYAGSAPAAFAHPTTGQSLVSALRAPLDSQSKRHMGIAVEIAAPDGLLSYDLDHSLVPDAHYLDLVQGIGDWISSVANSSDVCRLHESTRRHRDIQVADRLHTRQTRIRHNPLVYLRGEPVLQEPQSEKDVLALYFKLEGARALPVASCCVLEHTPARDTDAIGHYRLSSADALNQFALIEFEYQFSNFIAHGHSVRHVDLVICWKVSPNDALRTTEHPWLMTFTGSDTDKVIPVLVLRNIPHLEIKKHA